MDETYVRVKGRWCYLYRAIDSTGATIDFVLSGLRDAATAKHLLPRDSLLKCTSAGHWWIGERKKWHTHFGAFQCLILVVRKNVVLNAGAGHPESALPERRRT